MQVLLLHYVWVVGVMAAILASCEDRVGREGGREGGRESGRESEGWKAGRVYRGVCVGECVCV